MAQAEIVLDKLAQHPLCHFRKGELHKGYRKSVDTSGPPHVLGDLYDFLVKESWLAQRVLPCEYVRKGLFDWPQYKVTIINWWGDMIQRMFEKEFVVWFLEEGIRQANAHMAKYVKREHRLGTVALTGAQDGAAAEGESARPRAVAAMAVYMRGR